MKTLPASPSVPHPPAGGYLGPATVLEVADRQLYIESPDCLTWAQSALLPGYAPVPGDTVLALSDARSWYVVGLLQGTGETSIVAPGHLSISAPAGRVDIQAGEEICFHSPKLTLRTFTLDICSRWVTQRFEEFSQWVKGTLRVEAGRQQTRVEEDIHHEAQAITHSAKDDVRLRGKMIHLN